MLSTSLYVKVLYFFIQYSGRLTGVQPRLSVNAVTSQNFELPVKIAAFVNDIFVSYSLVRIFNSHTSEVGVVL